MGCSQGHSSCSERREPVARTLHIPIGRLCVLTQLLPVSGSVTVLPVHRVHVWYPGGLCRRLEPRNRWDDLNDPLARPQLRYTERVSPVGRGPWRLIPDKPPNIIQSTGGRSPVVAGLTSQ